MDADLVAFILIAAVLLATSVATVVSKRLFYSALWLAATLVGVSAIFLLLQAEFLFVVQILVYVGAIVTLILFAIMFTGGTTQEDT